MATRMQQRRGTAAQWISTNAGAGPVLNAGEIGWESDTNKFKIGDGTNNWSSLDYFFDANSTLNPAFGSSITFEGATANDHETILAITDPTADRTVTFQDATGTVVLRDSTDTLTNKSISLGSNTVTSTLAQLNTAVSDADVASLAGSETFTNKTLTSPVINTPTGITKTDVGLENVDNTTDANKPVSTAGQTALDLKANLAGATFTGAVSGTSLTLSGNLTVQGSTTTIDSTTIAIQNAFVFEGITANDFETTLTVTDPTADRTLTLPDATDTLLGRDTTDTLTNKSISATANTLTGVINNTLLTTTGDIIYASSANTPARLGIGSAGQILKVSAGGIVEWGSAESGGAAFSEFMLIGA